MKSLIEYEMKPIECWQRAKELQGEHNRRAWGAREEGRLQVGMEGNALAVLVAGLGSCENLSLGQLGVQIAVNRELAIECLQAWEAQGYARDMCAYTRMNCGAMFLDYGPHGNYPRPDFFLGMSGCENGTKCTAMSAEHLGVPHFSIECPVGLEDEIKPFHLDHLVSGLQDAIEWMEKITGREYQDELLIEAVKNGFRSTTLWARIWQLNQTVPAPLSQRMMSSLSFPVIALPHTKEGVEFCQMLLDEVEDRVQNKIAALATERCRLLHESQPPYYFLSFFRYVERYGALFIGSRYDLVLNGGFVKRADGSWEVAQTPEERGVEIKTREDALRAFAERQLGCRNLGGFWGLMKANEMIKVVEDWHADGVVMHLNRGCIRLTGGLAETRRALQENGIPSMTYEANAYDPREFSETHLIDQLDSFLESLGLSRIDG